MISVLKSERVGSGGVRTGYDESTGFDRTDQQIFKGRDHFGGFDRDSS
jgi:hypothetical protein